MLEFIITIIEGMNDNAKLAALLYEVADRISENTNQPVDIVLDAASYSMERKGQ